MDPRGTQKAPVAPAWLRLILMAVGAYAAAVGLLVYVLGYTDVWYGLHDITDVPLYFGYAAEIFRGQHPYRDFALEYPPLSLLSFALAGPAPTFESYELRFAVEMVVALAAAAVVTALAASRLWPAGRRAHVAAVGFAAAVVANGAIVLNRFDALVALVFAGVLAALARCAWVTAAALVGAGFALKLVPAILLPVVLVLAPGIRTSARAAIAFCVAALVPFYPFVVGGAEGLLQMLRFHLDRPLQVESTFAASLLVRHVAGWGNVRVYDAFGGQALAGTESLARLATVLALGALTVTYATITARREALRARPQLVPLAVLATLLAFLTFSKVLSPQFLVWLVPVAALVIPERPLLGAGALLVTVLTQLEFPALYGAFVELRPAAVVLVAARNALLAAVFVCSVVNLWQIPRAQTRASESLRPSPAAS